MSKRKEEKNRRKLCSALTTKKGAVKVRKTEKANLPLGRERRRVRTGIKSCAWRSRENPKEKDVLLDSINSKKSDKNNLSWGVGREKSVSCGLDEDVHQGKPESGILILR